MRDYDGKSSPDFMGRGMGKGAGGSKLGEFFPSETKVMNMKRPGEIGMPKYPDTASMIEEEQKGNVRLANSDKASGKKRK